MIQDMLPKLERILVSRPFCSVSNNEWIMLISVFTALKLYYFHFHHVIDLLGNRKPPNSLPRTAYWFSIIRQKPHHCSRALGQI